MMKLQAKIRLQASKPSWHLSGEYHGHVVARPDQMRARCGGLTSTILKCSVCQAEDAQVKAGTHPGLKV